MKALIILLAGSLALTVYLASGPLWVVGGLLLVVFAVVIVACVRYQDRRTQRKLNKPIEDDSLSEIKMSDYNIPQAKEPEPVEDKPQAKDATTPEPKPDPINAFSLMKVLKITIGLVAGLVILFVVSAFVVSYFNLLEEPEERAERIERETQEAIAEAEAEARARVALEVREKAVAEARAIAEAEARAKAEAEAKARAKAETEAKARAKREAKARFEREYERQAKLRAREKAEAEARAEAESKARAIAEAKAGCERMKPHILDLVGRKRGDVLKLYKDVESFLQELEEAENKLKKMTPKERLEMQSSIESARTHQSLLEVQAMSFEEGFEVGFESTRYNDQIALSKNAFNPIMFRSDAGIDDDAKILDLCKGRIKFAKGKSRTIYFYEIEDVDGDRFIGYKLD